MPTACAARGWRSAEAARAGARGAGAGRPRRATSERQPSELSGGQQQRVAVARALVLEPSVLLFDEPLSNLDARLRRQMREEIRELQQRLGLTVVYVTHDQQEAMAVSDRIIVMNAGRIEQQGAPARALRAAGDAVPRPLHGRIEPRARPRAPARCRSTIRLRLGDAEIDIADATAADGEATVAVRPEAITVETAPGPAGALAGTIAKASYLGTHMEYSIDTAAGMLFATCPRVERPLGPGQRGEPAAARRAVSSSWRRAKARWNRPEILYLHSRPPCPKMGFREHTVEHEQE